LRLIELRASFPQRSALQQTRAESFSDFIPNRVTQDRGSHDDRGHQNHVGVASASDHAADNSCGLSRDNEPDKEGIFGEDHHAHQDEGEDGVDVQNSVDQVAHTYL